MAVQPSTPRQAFGAKFEVTPLELERAHRLTFTPTEAMSATIALPAIRRGLETRWNTDRRPDAARDGIANTTSAAPLPARF